MHLILSSVAHRSIDLSAEDQTGLNDKIGIDFNEKKMMDFC
jgi:hypothetical protein